MALINGTIDKQADQESTELIALLKKNGVRFSVVDATQRSKELLAQVSSVPIVYLDGKPLADLSTISKLDQEGSFATVLPVECIQVSLESRLKKLINQEKIMVFIKGTVSAPQCGFS